MVCDQFLSETATNDKTLELLNHEYKCQSFLLHVPMLLFSISEQAA